MPDAIVIGAGPAGLASAAMLAARGFEPVILERAECAGAAWRGHYDGLKLHTVKGRSALPGLRMPKGYPRFPMRDQVVSYLEDYVAHHGLRVRTGCIVEAVDEVEGGWRVRHAKSEDAAPVVVFATGLNGTPFRPDLPGFDGQVLHSSDYRRAEAVPGERVLVVGLGNSGGDIAVDLAKAGRSVDLSVRGPVNIVPKMLMGIPITSLGLLRLLAGPRVADMLAAPLMRRAIGRPEDYGFVSHPKGPMVRLVEEGKVPLIDPGVLPLIRAGKVGVKSGIAGAAGRRVSFAGGGSEAYDAIVFATGYRVDLRPFLGPRDDLLDEAGVPLTTGTASAAPGLYFVGYRAAPEGQLKRVGIEARAVAAHASSRRKSPPGR